MHSEWEQRTPRLPTASDRLSVCLSPPWSHKRLWVGHTSVPPGLADSGSVIWLCGEQGRDAGAQTRLGGRRCRCGNSAAPTRRGRHAEGGSLCSFRCGPRGEPHERIQFDSVQMEEVASSHMEGIGGGNMPTRDPRLVRGSTSVLTDHTWCIASVPRYRQAAASALHQLCQCHHSTVPR